LLQPAISACILDVVFSNNTATVGTLQVINFRRIQLKAGFNFSKPLKRLTFAPLILMTRSVNIITHKDITEQQMLFDLQPKPTHHFVRYFLQFEFWENDTLVFEKTLYLSTHSRDWHFKSRLVETIKKDIVQSRAFAFTNWNKRENFKYSYVLQDNAQLFNWINQKSMMLLFDIA
jgi:hypothetical protein